METDSIDLVSEDHEGCLEVQGSHFCAQRIEIFERRPSVKKRRKSKLPRFNGSELEDREDDETRSYREKSNNTTVRAAPHFLDAARDKILWPRYDARCDSNDDSQTPSSSDTGEFTST